MTKMTAEQIRLEESRERSSHWKRWGPYVSERAWGTVREDYSPYGTAWDYFPHDHARSRAYRWNEDGIAGICDRHQQICFALAMWNGKDPILKERIFGLTGNEGNHGEDVCTNIRRRSFPTSDFLTKIAAAPRTIQSLNCSTPKSSMKTDTSMCRWNTRRRAQKTS